MQGAPVPSGRHLLKQQAPPRGSIFNGAGSSSGVNPPVAQLVGHTPGGGAPMAQLVGLPQPMGRPGSARPGSASIFRSQTPRGEVKKVPINVNVAFPNDEAFAEKQPQVSV